MYNGLIIAAIILLAKNIFKMKYISFPTHIFN